MTAAHTPGARAYAEAEIAEYAILTDRLRVSTVAEVVARDLECGAAPALMTNQTVRELIASEQPSEFCALCWRARGWHDDYYGCPGFTPMALTAAGVTP